MEELEKRILQASQHRPYGNAATIPELIPQPEFTYRFPERSSNSEKSSQFAVDPSDPKYYENFNGQTDSLFPRQSKSDEDYESAVFDSGQQVEPESPTQLSPQSAAVSQNHQVASSRKETTPGDLQQVYKMPVDSDDKSDLYFIAIVAGCSAAAVVGVIAIGISWYK
ncbi:hypothetical protein L9F63_024560 [Diploptera punctata]|uniref:Uncharacterized protein n=1 Tax=Diploptera punctata TaxID=6984 RepID=A0AAD7ZEQ2_DIPPU|nr:hypothetical protein L9F63_024560 [Diploptera punctata]